MALLSIPAIAQEERAPAQGEKTLTGCLNAASQPGQFVLTVTEGGAKGQKVAVIGGADLEAHAKNHTVRVTGMLAKEGGGDVLKASKVQLVDEACQAPTE
jgi:hypothetical protein